MSEWEMVVSILNTAVFALNEIIAADPNDTQARLWRDHLANDYKSLSLHAQKAQDVA